MLNRHAIVLYLGLAALFALVRPADAGFTGLGVALVVTLVGLMVDDGMTPARVAAGHLAQLIGSACFVGVAAVQLIRGGAWALPAAEIGIALAVLGVLLEMRLPYGRLRLAIGVHALGDAVFLLALALGVLRRELTPTVAGWVFIGIASAVSLYAAGVNLGLQISRLRNAKAGWRYRVLDAGPGGLKLKTLDGEATVAWKHVQAVKPIDARHLMVVLPSPLPDELSKASLPVEELRESETPVGPNAGAPTRYALVLHEQELGAPIAEILGRLQTFVPA